jgi:AcrR family transcriptional regulator
MKGMDPQPTRRERLRRQTSDEIKQIALELMTDGGPGAISLRSIARRMGMTAAAIYSYYPTRDDLITALIGELYLDLVETVEAARDAEGAEDPTGRILAWGEAFRVWSLANPQGFRLIYGDPIPGYQAPDSGPSVEAELRACTGLTGLIAAIWPSAADRPSRVKHRWVDFDPELVAAARADFPELPPAAIALALRVWARMHGLVSLEVYGHLAGQTREPAKLYRAELLDLIAELSPT